MKLSADSTFHIGQFHIQHVSPCQDYADHWVDGERARMVVSDGCSTGGKTDVGARFIARRLLAQQAENPELDFTVEELFRYGLELRDMFATALVCSTVGANVRISLQGDGVVVWLYPDAIEIERFDWNRNMPFYPIYRFSSELFSSFVSAHSGNAYPLTRTFYCPKLELAEEHRYHLTERFNLFRPICGLRGVALFSDGICQIGRNNSSDLLDWREAVQECLDFKNTTGDFVKRRVRRVIQNWAKVGLHPQDDLSVAVLLID